MENRIWKVVGFGAIGLIFFVATMIIIRWVVDFVTWSTLDSGWAQAIGSIAAILFAYFLGERQAAAAMELARETNRMDARRRYDAILALAESADVFTARVAAVFTEDGFGYLQLKLEYRDAIMDDLISSVNAVSAQELGSYSAILALTTLREALANFKGNVTRARASHEALRDPVINSIPPWHAWNPSALHLCRKQIKRSIDGLQRYRPPFAQ